MATRTKLTFFKALNTRRPFRKKGTQFPIYVLDGKRVLNFITMTHIEKIPKNVILAEFELINFGKGPNETF